MSPFPSSLEPAATGLAAWQDASLADLCAHLAATHHARLRAELPHLAALMARATAMPGPHQAALQAAPAVLERFARDMLAHMDHEERVVFPLITRLERGEADPAAARRYLNDQALELESAHVGTGSDLDELHRICDTVPAPAETEPLLGELLELFARVIADTYLHIEKEHQILLPRALARLA